MAYSDLLKDPRWQKKRLLILNRDEFTCAHCGDTETTLHVHHIEYIKGRKPWDYDDDYLITLCEDCHEIQHLKMTYLEKFLLACVRSRDREDTVEFRKLTNKIIKAYFKNPESLNFYK